jgi:hypothetical protein
MVQPANKRFVMESDLNDFRDEAYRYVTTLYYTSSGTFVKANYPWLRAIRVKCQGGGGGGAGAAATAATTTSIGTGGNAGHYAESFITDMATVPVNVNVTVPAGGSGGIGSGTLPTNAGGASFAFLVTASGGAGGVPRVATAPPYFTAPNPSTITATGDLTIPGGAASPGISLGTTSGSGIACGGGSSVLGQASADRAVFSFLDGVNETSYGCGGGAAGCAISQAVARTGGSGAPGIVVVELYA